MVLNLYLVTSLSQEHLILQHPASEPQIRTIALFSTFKSMFWHNGHVPVQNCSQRRFRVTYCTE